jgi:hypothetical protein
MSGMFARILAMLAVLAISVATTVTTVHAARMGAVQDHAVHVAGMMQAQGHSDLSCLRDPNCGTADPGLCAFVCAALSGLLPSQGRATGAEYRPVCHELLSGDLHPGRGPSPNERPPKLRLL